MGQFLLCIHQLISWLLLLSKLVSFPLFARIQRYTLSFFLAVRVRPISSSELASRSTSNCPVEAVILNPPTSLATLPDNRLFSFDRVFSPDASQEEVYHEVVRPLIDSFLEGIFLFFLTSTTL